MFTLKAKSQNIILVNRKLIICRKMELNEFLSMSQCIYSVKCWLDVFWIGFLKMFKCLFASTASAIEAEQPRDREHLPSTGLLPDAQGWTRLMFWASVWLLTSWSRNWVLGIPAASQEAWAGRWIPHGMPVSQTAAPPAVLQHLPHCTLLFVYCSTLLVWACTPRADWCRMEAGVFTVNWACWKPRLDRMFYTAPWNYTSRNRQPSLKLWQGCGKRLPFHLARWRFSQ